MQAWHLDLGVAMLSRLSPAVWSTQAWAGRAWPACCCCAWASLLLSSYLSLFGATWLATVGHQTSCIVILWHHQLEPGSALLVDAGLGRKSVACVLLLCLGQRDFPVDTNVGRISARLGWIPLDAEHALEAGAPAEVEAGVGAHSIPKARKRPLLHAGQLGNGNAACSQRLKGGA